jgi:hypothetical protein
MSWITQTNKLTPDYFYEAVAKKTGVPKDVVKDVYNKYLSRVQELGRTETKIMIKGLGTFQLSPSKLLAKVYNTHNVILHCYDAFTAAELEPWAYEKLEKTSVILKKLNQLKKKYEFIERSLEDIWSDQRGIAEFLDNQGNYRRDIKKADGNLQQLPKQEDEYLWGMRLRTGIED